MNLSEETHFSARRQPALARWWRSACVALVGIACGVVHAEEPLPSIVVPAPFVSKAVNVADAEGTVAYDLVQIPGATWVRLRFGDAALPSGTALRMTSLADGAQQWLDASALAAWRQTSAYFNGDAVFVELVVTRGARGVAQLVVDSADVGVPSGGVASICGAGDDRTPISDPRIARMLPVACTAFLIDDLNGCLLTAGHCATDALEVAEFNVPPSDASGAIVHPPPSDQYIVDGMSVQSANADAGSDWAYFGLIANTTTGLAARAAQAAWFELDASARVSGNAVRVSGFGWDNSPPTDNFAPQTALGVVISTGGTSIAHDVDTVGGNSGSPLVDEISGRAFGVHTSGGCNAEGGTNVATGLWHPGLETAFAFPSGTCAPVPPLSFTYPGGKPQLLPPQGGGMLAVAIVPEAGESVLPGSTYAWVRIDGDELFTPVPLAPVSRDVYIAALPPAPCGSVVEWFVSAANAIGTNVADPAVAPQNVFVAISAIGEDIAFGDSFEADLGWTVSSASTVTAGAWERAVPTGGGARRDPPTDGDGSSHCYLTQDGPGDTDLDGGWTRLTSPVLVPARGSDPHLHYLRWFDTSASADDALTVEISNDDGESWTTVEVVVAGSAGASGGWFAVTARVSDFVVTTEALRVRFTASDTGQPSVTEAAIDGFALQNSASGVLCWFSADLDGDGVVGSSDLAIVLGAWGACPACSADLNADGTVGEVDLAILLGEWS